MGGVVRRGWTTLLGLADRRGAVLLALVAASVHAVESVGWPARPGRDFASYIGVYDQLWDWHAVFPWTTLQRPPVSPLVLGGTLELGAGVGAELALVCMFAASVVAWSAAARMAGGNAPAVLTGVALVLHPGYGELFHEWSGDVVFATAFALWAPILVRALTRPTVARFLAVGLGTALLALVRPGNQSLVLLALAPLLLRIPWTRRATLVAATGLAAVAPLACWAGLNAVRYDDLTVARGARASLPFFRAFVDDRIVRPENGPATRRLARLVEAELLPLEPYRSYGVDLDAFFASGSPRMHEDLVSLSDRSLGWDSDYELLGEVGIEAVRAHPGVYARSVLRDLYDALTQPLYGPSTEAPRLPGTDIGRDGAAPTPTQGQPIPAANQGAYLGTPENRIREVWTSPTRRSLVFRRAGDEERVAALAATIERMEAMLPTHGGSRTVARWLDRASRAYPPALAFAVVGLVALAWRRPRDRLAAVAPSFAALVVLVTTLLSLSFVAQYGIPLVPAFVLLAAVGLVGERSTSQRQRASATRS